MSASGKQAKYRRGKAGVDAAAAQRRRQQRNARLRRYGVQGAIAIAVAVVVIWGSLVLWGGLPPVFSSAAAAAPQEAAR